MVYKYNNNNNVTFCISLKTDVQECICSRNRSSKLFQITTNTITITTTNINTATNINTTIINTTTTTAPGFHKVKHKLYTA